MTKRLEEFDVLKGIAILLVALVHCKIGDVPNRLFLSFLMPVFLLISGYFYHQQAPQAFLKKTAMRLLVPWLFFATLCIIYDIILGFFLSHDIKSSIIGTFAMIDPMNENCNLLYRSIWFLIALFLTSNIYNCIRCVLSKYHIDNPRWLDSIVLLTYIAGYCLERVQNLPFFIDTAVSAVLYYHLGYVFKSFQSGKDSVWMSPWLSGLVFAVMMFVPVFVMKLPINLRENQYPYWLPFYEIPVCIALYNMVKWFCSKAVFLPLRSLFVRCGFYSICFLGMHHIVLDIIHAVYDRIPAMNHTIGIVIYFAVLIPLVLWLSKVLEKYAPVLIGSKRK